MNPNTLLLTYKGLINSSEIRIEHYLVLEKIELIIIDGDRYFVVDRDRGELRNLLDPAEVFPLAQRQIGRLPDGDLEVLERYQADDETGESVCLDASPSWLAQLPKLNR
jgi:hypothetical protein